MSQYSLETIRKPQSHKVTSQGILIHTESELWPSLWLFVSVFEAWACPDKGKCDMEGFKFHPWWVVLQILYVFLIMLVLGAYFSDILLTFLCFLCEESKKWTLTSNHLTAGVHLVLRSLLSFSESHFLISDKCTNSSCMHITISFFVLAASGESRTKFESQNPLLLDVMIYSTVKKNCNDTLVDWGRRKKLRATQPHWDVSNLHGMKEKSSR